MATRVWWTLQVALFVASIALCVWHVDAATVLARNVPAAAPYACRLLAWTGGEGVDRLLGFAIEEPPLRGDALAALEHVSDPDDAKKRVTAKLPELRRILPKLDRATRGHYMIALGRAGVGEELETITGGLAENDIQLSCVRALAYLGDRRGRAALVDLLGQWEWQLKRRPEVIVAVLQALAALGDDDGALVDRCLPFLVHESAGVRVAAADIVAEHTGNQPELKKQLLIAKRGEQGAIRARLATLERALAAVGSAGEGEKDPYVKAQLAAAFTALTGEEPAWAAASR